MTVKHALALDARLDKDGIRVNERAELHFVARIDPIGQAIEGKRPALSVVFALDVSGSMAGPPLEHVIQSVGKLIDLLDPIDKVGVVAFSQGATTVAPVQMLTHDTKRQLKRRVRRLTSDGGTNIEAGLRLAREILPDRQVNERQLILLLSDGAPNIGISNADGLASLAADMRPDVAISTLGFGAHHNEDVLHAISDAGAGDYAYIAAPLECDYEFARALGAQGDVVADGIELVLTPEDGVEIAGLLSQQRTRIGAGGLVVSLADAMEGRPQYVIARLSLKAPSASGPWEALGITLRYRIAGQIQVLTLDERLIVPVRHQAGRLVPEVYARVMLAEAEVARHEARAMADRGHFDGAAAILRQLIGRIEASACYTPDDGSDLSEAVEQLLDEAMAYERRPNQEEYRAFRRVSLGVDMQQGGDHGTDRTMVSRKAKAICVGTLEEGGLPDAWLLISNKDGAPPVLHHLNGGEISIGRTQGNDIVVPRGNVSKRQLRIIGHQGRYVAVDLKSTNGTYLNGRKLSAPAVLNRGDQIYVGDSLFEYHEA